MHNGKVPVTIDGRTVQVHPGNHSFAGILAELGITKRTLELAGAGEEVIALDVTPPPPQHTRIGGNGGYIIHGGEIFTSVRQAVPEAAA